MEFKNISVNGISYGDDKSLSDNIYNNLNKVTNVDFRDSFYYQSLNDPN